MEKLITQPEHNKTLPLARLKPLPEYRNACVVHDSFLPTYDGRGFVYLVEKARRLDHEPSFAVYAVKNKSETEGYESGRGQRATIDFHDLETAKRLRDCYSLLTYEAATRQPFFVPVEDLLLSEDGRTPLALVSDFNWPTEMHMRGKRHVIAFFDGGFHPVAHTWQEHGGGKAALGLLRDVAKMATARIKENAKGYADNNKP